MKLRRPPAQADHFQNFDSTHNFIGSYSLVLPFDRAFARAPKRLVQGWRIAGITRFATGFPVGIVDFGDRALRGDGRS